MSIKLNTAPFAELAVAVEKWAAKQERKVPAGKVLSEADRALAIHWYAVCSYDIQTIADHFKVDVETLKAEIRS